MSATAHAAIIKLSSPSCALRMLLHGLASLQLPPPLPDLASPCQTEVPHLRVLLEPRAQRLVLQNVHAGELVRRHPQRMKDLCSDSAYGMLVKNSELPKHLQQQSSAAGQHLRIECNAAPVRRCWRSRIAGTAPGTQAACQRAVGTTTVAKRMPAPCNMTHRSSRLTCCVPFMNNTILFWPTKSSSACRSSGFSCAPGAATPVLKLPAAGGAANEPCPSHATGTHYA